MRAQVPQSVFHFFSLPVEITLSLEQVPTSALLLCICTDAQWHCGELLMTSFIARAHIPTRQLALRTFPGAPPSSYVCNSSLGLREIAFIMPWSLDKEGQRLLESQHSFWLVISYDSRFLIHRDDHICPTCQRYMNALATFICRCFVFYLFIFIF